MTTPNAARKTGGNSSRNPESTPPRPSASQFFPSELSPPASQDRVPSHTASASGAAFETSDYDDEDDMDVEEEGFDHNPAPSQNIGLGDGGDRTIGGGAGTSHATRKTMSGSSRAAEMGWRQGPRRDEVLRVLQTVVDKDFSLAEFGDPFDQKAKA